MKPHAIADYLKTFLNYKLRNRAILVTMYDKRSVYVEVSALDVYVDFTDRNLLYEARVVINIDNLAWAHQFSPFTSMDIEQLGLKIWSSIEINLKYVEKSELGRVLYGHE
jgi:hypothetical protein